MVPEEKPQAALVPSLPLTHLLLRGDLGSRVGPECHPLGGLFFASSLALLMLVAPVCVSVLPGIHLHAWHRCLWVTRLVSPTPTFFLHPLCRLLQDAPVLGPLPVTLLAPSKGVAHAPAPCPITASPQSPPRSPRSPAWPVLSLPLVHRAGTTWSLAWLSARAPLCGLAASL